LRSRDVGTVKSARPRPGFRGRAMSWTGGREASGSRSRNSNTGGNERSSGTGRRDFVRRLEGEIGRDAVSSPTSPQMTSWLFTCVGGQTTRGDVGTKEGLSGKTAIFMTWPGIDHGGSDPFSSQQQR